MNCKKQTLLAIALIGMMSQGAFAGSEDVAGAESAPSSDSSRQSKEATASQGKEAASTQANEAAAPQGKEAAATPVVLPKKSPTQAYLDIHAMEQKATCYDDLLPFRSKKSIAKDKPMTDAEKSMFFPLFKAILPKQIKVTGEKIEGSTATVFVDASTSSEKTTGEVTLSIEDGQWKLEKERWNSKSEIK